MDDIWNYGGEKCDEIINDRGGRWMIPDVAEEKRACEEVIDRG
jgi:hypothetical protein